jgi:hypothetical protein
MKLTLIIFVLAGLGTFLYLRFPVRPTRASNPCMSNLSQIESAKSQWAVELNKSSNDIPSWEPNDTDTPGAGPGPSTRPASRSPCVILDVSRDLRAVGRVS